MSNLRAASVLAFTVAFTLAFTFLNVSVSFAAEPATSPKDLGKEQSVLSFLVPADQVAKVRAESITKPVNRAVVNAKINRIAQKVQSANPELLTSVQATYKDSRGLISDALVLSIVAKSPLFKSMGLSMEVATDRKFIKLRDRISFSGTIEVSGYDILKSFATRMAEDAIAVQDNKYATADQFLREKSIEAERNCEAFRKFRIYERRDSMRVAQPAAKPAPQSNSAPDLGDTGVPLLDAGICVYGHHLYKSLNYSDFLERVAPIMTKVRILAGRELYEKYGWFTVLSGYDLSICTKSNYTCRGEYLYLKGSFGVIASSVSGAVKFEENRVTLEVSAYSFRSLSEYFVSDSSSPDIDLAKYFVLKQIENMDDKSIDEAARVISDLIESSEKSVNEFKGAVQQRP
ncbi:MAG: hypothetical protein J0L82_09820 [Deltaproteobacteria bacterium]|jgi:hypothetical protein|nr:hypothetical protein [Deltaproteobacteria bacterium]